MSKLQEIIEKRAALIHEARSILDSPLGENGQLTAEQQTRYDKLFDDANNLSATLERHQKQIELDALAETRSESGNAHLPDSNAGDPDADNAETRAMERYLMEGRVALSNAEYRALSAGTNSEGGHLKAPPEMVEGIIKAIDNTTLVPGWATVYEIDELGQPSLDTDVEDATWTTEVGGVDEDTALAFGKRNMAANPARKLIKVSKTLLRRVPSVAALVEERMGYKFGVTAENAYLNGSGSGQPLGVFTASASGVPASRDFNTGNTATAITFAGLFEAKYGIKAGHLANSRWLFHRDAVKMIAKITDSNGQYIWQESTRAGEPDMLLGRPQFTSEYAPNTFAASAYVGMLADWSYYWILRPVEFQIQRLEELYAENNQTGFIGIMEGDGAPVLAEAFARVQLAAS